MTLEFELGKADSPSGHALMYFRDAAESEKIAASYVVVLPIPIDMARYIPPMLAGAVPQVSSSDVNVCEFPPVPEEVEGFETLKKETKRRGDDLIFGGVIDFSDVGMMMTALNEAVQKYLDAFKKAGHQSSITESEEKNDSDDPNSVIYSLMNEEDLLKEAASLMGKLQYALEGTEHDAISDTRKRLLAISDLLPENRKLKKLVQIASSDKEHSAKLASLYLERAYSLYREDYRKVSELEKDIASFDLPEESAN